MSPRQTRGVRRHREALAELEQITRALDGKPIGAQLRHDLVATMALYGAADDMVGPRLRRAIRRTVWALALLLGVVIVLFGLTLA